MRSSAAARRYARALFALAREENRVDAVRDELDGLAELLAGHAELQQALFRPLYPAAERRAVLHAVCQRSDASDTVRRFCAYLVEQRRLVDFDAIREEFVRLADEAAGRSKAHVVAANPLREDQRERLRRALTARMGKQVALELSVDPSLLGGAIATVGGLVFDGSLRTQLRQLRASLSRDH
jgi:F-type H+-transporting ATPase subunit delta